MADECIKFTLNYINDTGNLIVKLKWAELLFTLLSGAFGSSANTYSAIYTCDCDCSSQFGFFQFVAWTAFTIAAIRMVTHLLGLSWDTLLCRSPRVYVILYCMAAMGFLIGLCQMIPCAIDLCVSSKSRVVAAEIFGSVCMALFVLESRGHFKNYRRMQEEAQQQPSEEGDPPDDMDRMPDGVELEVVPVEVSDESVVITVNIGEQ